MFVVNVCTLEDRVTPAHIDGRGIFTWCAHLSHNFFWKHAYRSSKELTFLPTILNLVKLMPKISHHVLDGFVYKSWICISLCGTFTWTKVYGTWDLSAEMLINSWSCGKLWKRPAVQDANASSESPHLDSWHPNLISHLFSVLPVGAKALDPVFLTRQGSKGKSSVVWDIMVLTWRFLFEEKKILRKIEQVRDTRYNFSSAHKILTPLLILKILQVTVFFQLSQHSSQTLWGRMKLKAAKLWDFIVFLLPACPHLLLKTFLCWC